jgi:hypothetical protein
LEEIRNDKDTIIWQTWYHLLIVNSLVTLSKMFSLTCWTEVSGEGRIGCASALNVMGQSRSHTGALQDPGYELVDRLADGLQAEHFLGADDRVIWKARLVDGLGENSAFFQSTLVVEMTKVFAAKKNLKKSNK